MQQFARLVAAPTNPYPAGVRSESMKHLARGRRGKWDTSGILLPQSAALGALDLLAVFGNTHPVELEIGTGKGTFLLARAKARTEMNFLGIERARAYCQYAADRFRRAGLANVRMVCAEAGKFMRDCLPNASLWRVHVYFPDPWPKRRHRKRRLIQPSFAAEIRRVLAPGGQLIVVTDHIDYSLHIRRVLQDAADFARVASLRTSDQEGQIIRTNFERKYIAQRRRFYTFTRMRFV